MDDETEKIGYGRPPRHTRFQKGKSGNPKGKKKGVRSIAEELRRALLALVTLTVNGKTQRVTTQEALVGRLRDKALKGDARALNRLLDLALSLDAEQAAHPVEDVGLAAEDQAILDEFYEEEKQRRAAKKKRKAGSKGAAGDEEGAGQ